MARPRNLYVCRLQATPETLGDKGKEQMGKVRISTQDAVGWKCFQPKKGEEPGGRGERGTSQK